MIIIYAMNGLKPDVLKWEYLQNMLAMDCTLRDGANVVGKGFDAWLSKMMIEGMITAGIATIDMGNCLGPGPMNPIRLSPPAMMWNTWS